MDSNHDSIRAGEVRDFPGVKLSLPTLTSDPTVLTSTGELFFDPDARLVIVMRIAPNYASPPYASRSAGFEMARTASPSASSRAAENVKRQAVPSDLVPPLIENCVNAGCVTAPDTSRIIAEQAQTEISLRDLAYRPRITRIVVGGLEDDDAIAFLDDDQVFVTYNTHALVPRSETEAERSSAPRQIRGVLISALDGRRLRVVDWLVPEQGPYLWPLDKGRLLVHVGNALVVYTRDLEEEARWEIPGPLLFVTLSPSRNSILVAVKHERYDAATFRRLADFVGSAEKVQEDCDLVALNGHLEETGSHPLTQIPARPTLLDAGMISATRGTRSRWKIEETAWDKHNRQLAQLISACSPLLQSLPGNLLFASGCEADSKSKWYRILRSDGKTLLRGTTTNEAIPEYVDASADGSVFAVGVERAVRDVDWNTGMHIPDLESMTVAVYRAADGKQFYATRVPSHAIDRRVLALSPTGERLAVLTDSTVRIYRTNRTKR
jgi:dipeptidyl aminopeptidase/acylaminoacyl peptidase